MWHLCFQLVWSSLIWLRKWWMNGSNMLRILDARSVWGSMYCLWWDCWGKCCLTLGGWLESPHSEGALMQTLCRGGWIAAGLGIATENKAFENSKIHPEGLYLQGHMLINGLNFPPKVRQGCRDRMASPQHTATLLSWPHIFTLHFCEWFEQFLVFNCPFVVTKGYHVFYVVQVA